MPGLRWLMMALEPIKGADEPMDRLTRMADAMIKAMEVHPEYDEDDKCIVLVDDADRGGIALHGYASVESAIVDLMNHLQALLYSVGRKMELAFVPDDVSELLDG